MKTYLSALILMASVSAQAKTSSPLPLLTIHPPVPSVKGIAKCKDLPANQVTRCLERFSHKQEAPVEAQIQYSEVQDDAATAN